MAFSTTAAYTTTLKMKWNEITARMTTLNMKLDDNNKYGIKHMCSFNVSTNDDNEYIRNWNDDSKESPWPVKLYSHTLS